MRDPALKSVAVGFFDGVHLGHQALLAQADVALTFANHPLSVLAPARAPRLVMTAESRIALLRSYVSEVVVLPFTPELSQLSPETFAARHLPYARVYCGENWRFGRGGTGDAETLRHLGKRVEVVSYAMLKGDRISSTRLRATLQNGDVQTACEMMGRPWQARGTVFAGKGLGKTLSFPTVNVRLPETLVALRLGVYGVSVAGSPGIANYGVAPTLGAQSWPEPVLEIHFTGGMPAVGSVLDVSFHTFIRPERTFPTREALREQIERDRLAFVGSRD